MTMNCNRFQNEVFEYLDGALSPGARESAEQHLGQCEACRAVLQRQREVAQRLSKRFHKDTAAISLNAGAQRRILEAMADHSADSEERFSFASLLVRLAWVGGLAACIVLVVWLKGGFPSTARPLASRSSHSQEKSRVAISVDISYALPTCVSRQQGNEILDTLVTEPRMSSETIYLARD